MTKFNPSISRENSQSALKTKISLGFSVYFKFIINSSETSTNFTQDQIQVGKYI